MSIAESRFGRLTGHFFAGLLENDFLISAGGGMQSLFVQLVGLVATPGVFYCLVFCSLRYRGLPRETREIMAWDDRLLFVHIAMALAGLLAVIQWNALFPDRRDYHVLTPLPISARLLFAAKLCSIALLVVGFWAAGSAGPAVMFPMTSLVGDLDTVFRHNAAHMAATLAASAFAFLLLASVQGVLLNLLPPRWFRRASAYAQLGAVLALVVWFLATPVIVSEASSAIRGHRSWMYGCPSFWFLGVYQALIGRGSAVFDSLAQVAAMALVGTAVLGLAAYAAAYRRHIRRSLESLETPRSEPGPLARTLEKALYGLVLRDPLERGLFAFIRITMLRSSLHRLLLTALWGTGVALALAVMAAPLGSRGAPPKILLAVQPALLLFLLAAMRLVFTIPAELPANWFFQAADPADKRRCLAGVRKGMLLLCALPLTAILAPLHGYFWGWGMAAAQAVFGIALAVLIVELLLYGIGKLPFTCSYLPGKADLKTFWWIYLGGFVVYTIGAAKAASWVADRPWRLAAWCAAMAALTVTVRVYDARRLDSEFRFVFDERPEPVAPSMEIAHGLAPPQEVGAAAALPPG
jgi:hypothetical protein